MLSASGSHLNLPTHMSQQSQEAFDEEQTIMGIKKYDDEINRLEEQIEILRRERSLLRTQLDLYRASIAPIKRLSEDVLVLIFSGIIEDPPTAVGQLLFVCRAWYQLVTNQPTLWSSIESAPRGDTIQVNG
jgi:F-box-like